VIVEVFYTAGCPHAAAAVALVRACAARLGVDIALVERDGDHPSPSVRVDGRDVMGEPVAAGPACRLDRPTRERVMAALGAAARRPAP
jgi:hypothetical protein